VYIQITEAAKRLNLSRTWTYKLIAEGKIHTIRMGGYHFVIDDKDFRKLVKERKKGAK
jgi:excisionase family DNA binding protein